MSNTKVTKILMRSGSKQEWINADSVATLEIGEIGFESDTYRMKLGNVDNYTVGSIYKDLDYFAAGIVSIQEVDATHENGLMIDSVGKLELDIGQLVGRIDHHDSVFVEHADSIDSLRSGFDTVSQHLDEIEQEHRDSIETLIDSISFNTDSININNDSIQFIRDSIEVYADSITANKDDLELKVDKAGDTMSGPLLFEGDGVIGTTITSNLLLKSTSTFVNTLLEPRKGLRVAGLTIETNDSYRAQTAEDIVDVKSLKDINKVINRPVTHSSKRADGGNIYRSTTDENKIVYTPSIELKPIATEMLALLGVLDSNPDSVSAGDIRDILVEFFSKINSGVSLDLDYPIEYTNE